MEKIFKLTKDVPSDIFLEIYDNFFYTGAMLDFDKIDDETLRVSSKKDSMVEDRDLEELEKNISAFANEAFLYDMASCY
jgi:hypothetical protein